MQAVKSGTKTVSVSMASNVFDLLDAYCAERGCSRSWFITKAVQAYLAECVEDKDYKNLMLRVHEERGLSEN
ncbi:hypothetical protein [Treponema vincentii]|uniref:hypothetical protein n=1 Tax=Treponema vincentii TaxID=69710 RepID=UPI0020A4CC07|nr:hypothetical protein [Treponema vincentii]UTC47727.1 hypothetical protein E4N73_02170 [Treponema vincentii]